MTAKIERMELEKQREILKNKALTIASEKKLPINKIADLFIAEDEEATVANISRFGGDIQHLGSGCCGRKAQK